MYRGMQICKAPQKVKFTMSGIQSKITRHAKEKKTMTHNEDKNQKKYTQNEYMI